MGVKLLPRTISKARHVAIFEYSRHILSLVMLSRRELTLQACKRRNLCCTGRESMPPLWIYAEYGTGETLEDRTQIALEKLKLDDPDERYKTKIISRICFLKIFRPVHIKKCLFANERIDLPLDFLDIVVTHPLYPVVGSLPFADDDIFSGIVET